MSKYEFTARHVDTCCPCVLTDHHNRDGELLLGVYLGKTEVEAVSSMLSEIDYDRVPGDASEDEIEAALKEAVEGVDLRWVDDNGDEQEGGKPEDYESNEEEPQAWFLLRWTSV